MRPDCHFFSQGGVGKTAGAPIYFTADCDFWNVHFSPLSKKHYKTLMQSQFVLR